jgi:hypothetical protein
VSVAVPRVKCVMCGEDTCHCVSAKPYAEGSFVAMKTSKRKTIKYNDLAGGLRRTLKQSSHSLQARDFSPRACEVKT